MHDDLILVTGATGNTGSVVLSLLEARGARVRALVRRTRPPYTSPPTTETVVGNFDDAASLHAALAGVTRAYLVTPSSPDAEAQQIRFAESAAAAGVRQIVKLSQFAAAEASPVRFLRYHAAVEKRIRALGIGYTFLRPNLYFQGLLAFSSMIAGQGSFVAPIGDAPVSAIDCTRHCSRGGGRALTGIGHEGRNYILERAFPLPSSTRWPPRSGLHRPPVSTFANVAPPSIRRCARQCYFRAGRSTA